jgi:DnaJ family protein C protein 28
MMNFWGKGKRKQKLEQIDEALTEHQMSQALPPEELQALLPQPPRPTDRKAKEAARQSLIEQKIQQAMAEGKFDNLPGKGKPLNLNKNPYLDPSQELAFDLLQNNQLAPAWIEKDKEIRRELETARNQLRQAWQAHQADPTATEPWQRAVATFNEKLTKLNRKIDDFNLIAPMLSVQRGRLRLADELRRLQE